MSDLVAWLRAQLDDDGRLAKAADDAVVDFVGEETKDNGEPKAGKHIRRWLPARVLAEVEAKRKILHLHGTVSHDCVFHLNDEVIHGHADTGDPEFYGPCDTLKALALPYADRRGYLEEWRP